MKPKTKTTLILILSFVVFCLGICLTVELTSHPLRHWIDDVLYDNYNNYLPCRKLPLVEVVNATIASHQDVLSQIKQIAPGNVGWQVESCDGHADILFWYGSHTQREQIEQILGAGTFFGVPYRLRNQ